MKIYDIINEDTNNNPKKGVAEGSKWVDDNGDPIPINQGHWADKPGQKKWPAFKNIKTGKKRLHKDDPDFKKGVAEGEYDDPRWEQPEPDMSRKVDWDIEAERNKRGTEEESDKVVYIIDDNTDKVVLKFKSTGGYYGDVRHALKHGYDTEGGDYSIKWKRVQNETATAGSTSAGNIASIANPHLSPGKARGKKSYTGSPTTGSGTKAPPQPKVKQPKTSAGTAVNALDIKGASLFGGGSIKR